MMRRISVLGRAVAATSLALGGVSLLGAHPHGELLLWKQVALLRAHLESAPGQQALGRLDQLFGGTDGRPPSAAGTGAAAGLASRWAGRGQVDLVVHLLRRAAQIDRTEVGVDPHTSRCEICVVFRHDAIHGDPAEVAALPPGKNGILPITAHAFLLVERAALVRPEQKDGTTPAAESFLPHIDALDDRVLWGIGVERLDVDGDGTAETERFDRDDDGRFDTYHVDRDRDGVFEAEFVRTPEGRWKFAAHDRLLRQLRRARAATRTAPARSTPDQPSAGRDPE